MPLDYCIREGDKIIHSTVREETPVFAQVPKKLYESDTLIAFDKPSSMPVHACGNFHHNTLQEICQTEYGYGKLMTVHRLDRQTSGIVFFAKTDKDANMFREAMVANQVAKVYLARVLGDFRKVCTLKEQDGDKGKALYETTCN